MHKAFALLLVLLSALVARIWASERVILDGFEYATDEAAQAAWRPQQGSPPAARMSHHTEHGESALRFAADLARVDERGYWDRDVSLDLSRFGGFSLRVYAENAAAIGQGTIYFRSGDGWYGAWFPVMDGWQTVRLRKSDFRIEDQPNGWEHVETIRLSFWKAKPEEVVIAVDDLEAIAEDILVVRGNRSALVGSSEWGSVQEYVEGMAQLLDMMGLAFGVVDDTDVEAGVLAGAKLALFPHNPDMSARELDAIEAFVGRGGKIMLFYDLPDRLAPLLGIRAARWMSATYAGQFAAIALDAEQIEGLPASIRQDSWNARVPEVDGPDVARLGEWVDANGRRTGLTAITRNANGLFMGHVLTATDAPAKQRLMLALLGDLLPEDRASFATAALRKASVLAGFPDAEAVRRAIEENLEGATPSRREKVLRRAEAAQRLIQEGEQAVKEDRFADAVAKAQDGKEALRDAYFRSVPPRPKEFRGVWTHSAFGIPGWTWDQSIRHLAENGFTAIVPNMLWAGLAYYPSDVLPVADEIAEKGDQIAQALAAARKYGVQIHVWKVNWNLARAPESFVDKLRKEGRLQADRNGNEVKWLCPSDPRNFQLELDSMLEVVRKYDVDGIHFDYIRYPNRDACYDVGCKTRFEEAEQVTIENWPEDVITGPYREAFGDWRREQITRLVRAVSEQARQIRPGIQISAAVFRDYPNCRDTVGQDWKAWIDAGYLDFVAPMNYTANEEQFAEWTAAQIEIVGGRIPLYPGIGASAPGLLPEQTVRQVQRARALNVPGFMIFNFDAAIANEHLPALRLGATASEE